MSYFTDSDLTERLRGTGVAPVSGEVAAARAYAEGYVDAGLTGRYAVPFSPVPSVVMYLALDVAAYDVLTKHFTVEDSNVGDLIKQFWKRAMDTLAKLRDGRMSLHDVAALDEGQEKRAIASRTADDAVVTDDATEDW